jgi:hydrogenase expression/formation protein HypC
MCLAIPGRIVEIYDEQGIRMGKLDFGGTLRKCCLQYLPDATVGEYALVHVGFAITKVDAEEAARTYRLLQEIEEHVARLEAGEPESPGDPGVQP